MEQSFRAILLASSGVAALVGTRINWGAHPQGQPLPAVVLTGISENDTHHMTGPTRLYEARVQVDCYADTYSGAKALSRAILTVLDGYKGGVFQGIFSAGARDMREGGTNEAARPYRVSMDFMTHWSE